MSHHRGHAGERQILRDSACTAGEGARRSGAHHHRSRAEHDDADDDDGARPGGYGAQHGDQVDHWFRGRRCAAPAVPGRVFVRRLVLLLECSEGEEEKEGRGELCIVYEFSWKLALYYIYMSYIFR